MACHIIHLTAENEHGHVLSAAVHAYEVRFTHKPPESQFRRNGVALVVCRSSKQAIERIEELWPHDPVIVGVQLRSNDMSVIIDASVT